MRRIVYIFFLTLGSFIFTNANQLSFVHFSIEEGLASTYIKGITQDNDGFIWIITRENISRYDGTTFKEFPAYSPDNDQIKLIPASMYLFGDTLLLCESMDNYFFYFDFNYECFRPFTPLYSPIKKIELCSYIGNELLFIQGNELCKLNLSSQKIVISDLFSECVSVSATEGYISTFANNSTLFTATNNGKLLMLNKMNGRQQQFELPPEFKSDELEILYADESNNVWFRVYNLGLVRFSTNTGKYIHFRVGSEYPILHDLVHCVIYDNLARVWIGTENGLCIWDEEQNKILNYQYDKLYPQGLNTNPIYNAFKDKEGNIWLGTYFGGINLWNSKSPFFKSWTAGQSPYHLVGNVVSSFAEDKQGNLWIGTEDMGINMLDPVTGIIVKDDKLQQSIKLTYNNVHSLIFVDEYTLWIATYSGGINVYNKRTRTNRHINTSRFSEMPSDYIYTLIRKDKTVFIGGNSGVATYNLETNELKSFYKDQLKDEDVVSFALGEKVLWIASYNDLFSYDFNEEQLTSYKEFFENSGINQVVCDSKKQLWLATNKEGLIKFNPQTKSITYFNQSTGFPANRIFAFIEGIKGSLWVSCPEGLINFHENTDLYYLYDNNLGITANQFNFRAVYKDKNGQIYFGGNNGMVAFNENDSINEEVPNIRFTEFALFNKPVPPGKKSPLKSAINKCDKIELQYKQNVFTINFAAVNFIQRGQNVYAYQLEGFDKDFNYVGNRGSATYTNLNPGKYIFKVKASSNSWRSESEVKSIPVIIKPPYWKTGLAYVVYTMLIGIGLYLFYSIAASIQKSKATIELERREKKHIEEMNQAKLEFFTNISHEIKTPLTLIMGPLERFIQEDSISAGARKKLKRIYSNVRRLNTLLMELLEFRKIERGSMKLSVYNVKDFSFMHDIEGDFGELARKKKIVFEVGYPQFDVDLWFNLSILEKIIFNLLSNAFKYGASGNIISCRITIDEKTDENNEVFKTIKLTVSDNGIGIKKEDIERLFDRFYQVSDSKAFQQGVGIGLSFVKSLVDLHRGSIEIKSEPNKGSEFLVSLPASMNQFNREELTLENEDADPFLKEIEYSLFINDEIEQKTENKGILSDRPVVMMVDDNLELLNFMKEILSEKYVVYTAENGEEAYKKILEHKPEIIVSDVMMPVMDGLELTHKIKENIETSHIPVVLLTAKGGEENRFEGLKYGADLYIEKPFHPPVLEQNIYNILTTRMNLKNRFKNDLSISPDDTTYTSRDKEFINKLTNIILRNIDNSNVDVSFLVGELNVSRSLLHMKLKSLVNCSTTEFVRNIRMRKAMELITSNNCSYSEAAYRTGFSNPAYFSRCFKEIYGKSPREYFK